MSKSMSVGTVLKVNNKTVGGLKSIGGIEITADQHDVTALDSTGGFREFLAGFRDAGEVSCSGYLDGADEGQEEIYNLVQSGETKACQIIFPSKIGKTWSFNAVVIKYATDIDLDDAIKFDMTLKVSGQPTLAATATQGNG